MSKKALIVTLKVYLLDFYSFGYAFIFFRNKENRHSMQRTWRCAYQQCQIVNEVESNLLKSAYKAQLTYLPKGRGSISNQGTPKD